MLNYKLRQVEEFETTSFSGGEIKKLWFGKLKCVSMDNSVEFDMKRLKKLGRKDKIWILRFEIGEIWKIGFRGENLGSFDKFFGFFRVFFGL